MWGRRKPETMPPAPEPKKELAAGVAKTSSSKTEAGRTQGPKTEAVKAQGSKTEASRTEAPRTEASRSSAQKSEPAKGTLKKPEASRTENVFTPPKLDFKVDAKPTSEPEPAVPPKTNVIVDPKLTEDPKTEVANVNKTVITHAASTADPAEYTVTVIGKGMEIAGDLSTASGLMVYGSITGNVTSSGHVEIFSDARVKGTVTAQSVNVAGTVDGDVTTRGKLFIAESGDVNGDVNVRSLNVEEGGTLRGRCMMSM